MRTPSDPSRSQLALVLLIPMLSVMGLVLGLIHYCESTWPLLLGVLVCLISVALAARMTGILRGERSAHAELQARLTDAEKHLGRLATQNRAVADELIFAEAAATEAVEEVRTHDLALAERSLGRGFAVVADAVRLLAEQTGKAKTVAPMAVKG